MYNEHMPWPIRFLKKKILTAVSNHPPYNLADFQLL